jgi:hypothetical protein
VLDEGLKGSGSFSVLAWAYTTARGSFTEQNDNLHFVFMTIPHQFANGQCMEVAYKATSANTVIARPSVRWASAAAIRRASARRAGWDIPRPTVAGSLLYPQPIGFQAGGTSSAGD